MKKSIKVISALMIAAALASGLFVSASAAGKKLKLNKSTLKLRVGQSVKLKVKNKKKSVKLTWKSKNNKVATVSKNGKVVGRKEGNTKIVCFLKKGKDKSKIICKVNVLGQNNVIEKPQVSETPYIEPTPSIELTPNVDATPVNGQFASKRPEIKLENQTELYTGNKKLKFGMSLSNLRETMGEESYTLESEYKDCEWHVYNYDYANFVMVLVQNGEVVGFYADSKEFKYDDIDSDLRNDELRTAGYTTYDNEIYYLTTDKYETTVFVDYLDDKTVEGIFVCKASLQRNKACNTTTLEKVSFELSNSFRVKNNLPAFKWNEKVAEIARKHSTDMMKNDYFSHTSLDGSTPGDRLVKGGLSYSAYAENIAYGYSDGMHVTYGWINSSGHRNNLLFDAVNYLGVGVEESGTYYTQLFYAGW